LTPSKENLERQLQEIETSRAWKLLQRIGRTRARIAAVLGKREKNGDAPGKTQDERGAPHAPGPDRQPHNTAARVANDDRVPVGSVKFGRLRRVRPISDQFGFDRGLPIDRYYIENFLARYAGDIRGRVLEIGDASYTRRFGGERVSVSDVLHVREGNPEATIVADLSRGDNIASDSFDCIILTQTLHLLYEVRSAIRTIHRILKPGGVLLATFPGISQISRDEWRKSWYWAFTSLSARQLFEEAFPADDVEVETHGNVLAAISFLHGLATEELRKRELDTRDPAYEVLITLRAVKSQTSP
jgi:SAM-dependent methyltransferase